jgi:hypothetical protein
VTNSSPVRRTYVARILWVNPEKCFAMTHVAGIGRVTFSFNPDDHVWAEDSLPIKGADVVLSNLVSMEGGWRALEARYFRPEDRDLSK